MNGGSAGDSELEDKLVHAIASAICEHRKQAAFTSHGDVKARVPLVRRLPRWPELAKHVAL